MKYRYGWEKLYQAVHSLVGCGIIQERLISAVGAISQLKEHDMPDDLWSEFKTIKSELTVKKDEVQGAIRATISGLNEAVADEYTKKIFHLYDQITRHQKPVDK